MFFLNYTDLISTAPLDMALADIISSIASAAYHRLISHQTIQSRQAVFANSKHPITIILISKITSSRAWISIWARHGNCSVNCNGCVSEKRSMVTELFGLRKQVRNRCCCHINETFVNLTKPTMMNDW